ncbi:MAG: hypothetical protein CL844_06515 [Crocinitomicaceae bacterium]|nr:hypothetical protein [Crocinitomicaceae bacterium]
MVLVEDILGPIERDAQLAFFIVVHRPNHVHLARSGPGVVQAVDRVAAGHRLARPCAADLNLAAHAAHTFVLQFHVVPDAMGIGRPRRPVGRCAGGVQRVVVGADARNERGVGDQMRGKVSERRGRAADIVDRLQENVRHLVGEWAPNAMVVVVRAPFLGHAGILLCQRRLEMLAGIAKRRPGQRRQRGDVCLGAAADAFGGKDDVVGDGRNRRCRHGRRLRLLGQQ